MKVRKYLLSFFGITYRKIVKPIFFLQDPEKVHIKTVKLGEFLGNHKSISKPIESVFNVKNKNLSQKIHEINFDNPIGLAAGFDYEGRTTQILPLIGFGFQTIGTITNLPYEGNPRPMLGRLPKSKSLMVNKGFKNFGARKTIKRLTGLKFMTPIGISIGRSNNKLCDTQTKSIEDIIASFKLFEQSLVKHSYYELNISCPNLFGNVTFYPPNNLDALLKEVDKLHLKKPLFIKMPIEKTDKEVIQMLKVIETHTPAGVIFGNLQKDRKNKELVPSEVKKFKVGNFSGKPTFDRSNELIKLAYTNYGERLTIIGCGGVFNASDAYLKISLGASLVQLITGMIFNGPQIASEINLELPKLLKKDGLTKISGAVGRLT